MDKADDTTDTVIITSNLDHFIRLVECLLKDLIDNEGFQCQTMFNSDREPQIDLSSFIKRLQRYTQFSPECLIIAIIYLDRYNLANPDFSLNYLNVHKILLSCLLLATKFHDDYYYDNKVFELAGGVNTVELFNFQLQIFTRINFKIFIEEEEFQALILKLQDVYGIVQ